MSEMIARGCNNEMEVAICFGAIALGHNRLKGGRRLIECDPRLVPIVIEFKKAQPQPKQPIRITVEVEA